MGITLTHDIEVPVAVPASQNVGKSAEAICWFNIIRTIHYRLRSDSNCGAHDDK
jgi:hypothetical protein